MKNEPFRRIALRIDVLVDSIELFLRDTWKLEANTDRHDKPLSFAGEPRPYIRAFNARLHERPRRALTALIPA
jgi:hypothetical protein